MSICTPCYQSPFAIGNCTSAIYFGTSAIDAEVNVFVSNVSTGRVQKYECLTDEFGEVEVEGIKLNTGITYNVWVTNGSVDSERLPITVNSTVYDCITFTVIKVDWDNAASNLTPE